MPIYDSDTTTTNSISLIYDDNNSTKTQIAQIYDDDDNSVKRLIFGSGISEVSGSGTPFFVSGLQGTNTYIRSASFMYPRGYKTITINKIEPGTAYGSCITAIYHYDGTNFVQLRNIKRDYTGSSFTWQEQVTQQNTFTRDSGLNEICLYIDALYNPNVSGQHTSTAYIMYTLSNPL